MKRTTTLLLAFLVSGIAQISSQAQTTREFTSSNGKTLSGFITAADPTEVTIQMADGRSITGGVTFFSEEDQKYIMEWVKKNPVEKTYDFTLDTSRSRTDRRKETEGNTIVVYETWAYKIEIENRSKSGLKGADLSGLEIHYNIVKTALARADEATYLHEDLGRGGGRRLVLAGKTKLPLVEYLKEKEITTNTIPIASSELAPGWYYSDGSRDEAHDKLEGIWIKILKDGKVIHEEKSGTSEVEAIKWMKPKNK